LSKYNRFNISMNINYCFAFFLIGAFISIAGCGNPAPAGVSGTVKFEGKPLAGASISFIPADGSRSSEGATDANGKYELRFSASLKGAIVGDHNVVIRTAPVEVDSESTEKIVERLPAKYNNATELKATLKSGTQVVDFDLQP
jgi:predicted oxidoreductase